MDEYEDEIIYTFRDATSGDREGFENLGGDNGPFRPTRSGPHRQFPFSSKITNEQKL